MVPPRRRGSGERPPRLRHAHPLVGPGPAPPPGLQVPLFPPPVRPDLPPVCRDFGAPSAELPVGVSAHGGQAFGSTWAPGAASAPAGAGSARDPRQAAGEIRATSGSSEPVGSAAASAGLCESEGEADKGPFVSSCAAAAPQPPGPPGSQAPERGESEFPALSPWGRAPGAGDGTLSARPGAVFHPDLHELKSLPCGCVLPDPLQPNPFPPPPPPPPQPASPGVCRATAREPREPELPDGPCPGPPSLTGHRPSPVSLWRPGAP